MAETTQTIKILNQSKISPPPNSVPTTTLPLTFFDLPWLPCRPMQRLFFYEFPYDHPHFIHTLQTSLSLTLHRFFPLAASLISPPLPHKPFLLFSCGASSVSLTFAESSSLDFLQVIGDGPQDVRVLYHFVPKLPPASRRVVREGGGEVAVMAAPLLALQITFFPGSGICVGSEFLHVLADGVSFNHFMKSWAAAFTCETEGDSTGWIEKSFPYHDRTAIKDPRELESVFLEEWFHWASLWDYNVGLSSSHEDLKNKVRATFVLRKTQIKILKDLILDRCNNEILHVSTFVVTCAITWVSLIKSHEKDQLGSPIIDDDKVCYLAFVADCRNRLELECKIPTTYFGNCLVICYVAVKKSELVSENGVFVAAKAIGNKVKEMEKGGALEGAEKWMSTWKEISEEGGLITVAGSPKLEVYGTDFGWGRPVKSAVVQIDVSGALSLSESRDGSGGIEVGLALTRSQMEVFIALFGQYLKL